MRLIQPIAKLRLRGLPSKRPSSNGTHTRYQSGQGTLGKWAELGAWTKGATLILCSRCHSPIAASVDICPCGTVANRDKRKRKHGQSGKVRLKPYHRGQTPMGRFLAITIGEVTIRLNTFRRESHKDTDIKHYAIPRTGDYSVICLSAQTGQGIPNSPQIYTGSLSQARAVFQMVRYGMLANVEPSARMKRHYQRKSEHYRKLGRYSTVLPTTL
jgi:hypothetical protein